MAKMKSDNAILKSGGKKLVADFNKIVSELKETQAETQLATVFTKLSQDKEDMSSLRS